jgi:hypothetical protein
VRLFCTQVQETIWIWNHIKSTIFTAIHAYCRNSGGYLSTGKGTIEFWTQVTFEFLMCRKRKTEKLGAVKLHSQHPCSFFPWPKSGTHLTTDNPTSSYCYFELSNSRQMSIRLSSESLVFLVQRNSCFCILYFSIWKFDINFVLLNLSTSQFWVCRTIVLQSSLNCNK